MRTHPGWSEDLMYTVKLSISYRIKYRFTNQSSTVLLRKDPKSCRSLMSNSGSPNPVQCNFTCCKHNFSNFLRMSRSQTLDDYPHISQLRQLYGAFRSQSSSQKGQRNCFLFTLILVILSQKNLLSSEDRGSNY